MRIIFPLLMAIGFKTDHREWLHLVGTEEEPLHIAAFAVEEFVDRVLRQQKRPNPTAMLHFEKGTRLLRDRISGQDEKAKVSDSTISIVLKLASATHFNGDYKVSKYHMEGLREMIDLRGGIGEFAGTFMLVEILR